MNDRLYRSRDDRVIGGVCAGVADRLDLDPSLVRIGWVILTVLTGGLMLLLYIVMLFVVPEEGAPGLPPTWPAPPPSPGEGAIPGWAPPAPTGGWTAPGSAATVGATGPAAAEAAGGPAATPAGTAPPETAPSAAGGWVAPGVWGSPHEARAARRAARRERRAQRDTTVGLLFGLLLILLGAYFLFRQYVPNLDLDRFWPVVVIALGVLFIALAFRRSQPPAD